LALTTLAVHPKKDPITGSLMLDCFAFAPELIKCDGFIKVGENDGTRHELVSHVCFQVPRDDPMRSSFAHELMITKKWIVIFNSFVQFDASKILNSNENVLAFQKHVHMRNGLVARQGSSSKSIQDDDQIVWIDSGAPHVVVHPLNAWEDNDGTMVLWAPRVMTFDGDIDKGRNFFFVTEFRMNPNTGRVFSMTRMDTNYNAEFPLTVVLVVSVDSVMPVY
jgi:carotenoid cleavage dioxygenase-like enzyme